MEGGGESTEPRSVWQGDTAEAEEEDDKEEEDEDKGGKGSYCVVSHTLYESVVARCPPEEQGKEEEEKEGERERGGGERGKARRATLSECEGLATRHIHTCRRSAP